MIDFLLKGILIGFAIAVPIGPIGVLCIRRTLHYGRMAGLMSGLGAAIADTFFGAIAAFGLTFVSDFLRSNIFWFRLIGGFFLLYLGIKTFLNIPQKVPHTPLKTNYFGDFASTFFLTITNPLTIFGFAAIFASVGIAYPEGKFETPAFLVAGVFIGSSIWWMIISEVITFFRKKITESLLLWVNKIAALIITAFGIAVLLGAL